MLDTHDGQWASAADALRDTEDRYQRVVPYVQDHRNALLIKLAPHVTVEQRMAVMYALKRAIEAHFQLESNELAAEPMPGRTEPHPWSVLLMFEAAEGGAGVLRRVATDDGPLREVARKAIELLHYDPDTGHDHGKAEYATEPCAQACYDCLLSYSNQVDHQKLDRHLAIGLLTELAASSIEVDGDGETRATRLARLRTKSGALEREFLQMLDERGYRLPDEAQEIVDGYSARPDFSYRGRDMNVAIFLEGTASNSTDPRADQRERDQAARARLEDEAGWLVLRIRLDDPDWYKIVESNLDVFGAGRVGV